MRGQRLKNIAIITFVLIAIVYGALAIVFAPEGVLNRNKELWERQHIKDYQFELDYFCRCGASGNYLVRVESGRVVFVQRRFGTRLEKLGSELDTKQIPGGILNVDGYFANIKRNMQNANWVLGGVKVSYDRSLHYPQRIGFHSGLLGVISILYFDAFVPTDVRIHDLHPLKSPNTTNNPQPTRPATDDRLAPTGD